MVRTGKHVNTPEKTMIDIFLSTNHKIITDDKAIPSVSTLHGLGPPFGGYEDKNPSPQNTGSKKDQAD